MRFGAGSGRRSWIGCAPSFGMATTGLCVRLERSLVESAVSGGDFRERTASCSNRPQSGVPRDLARFIDHTILKPDATAAQVRQLCGEAIEHQFCSVCVNPIFVKLVAGELAGSAVKACSVVCFPFGRTSTAAKAAETQTAVADGAGEIDMVIAVGLLKAGDYDRVRDDIAEVKRACGSSSLKVIIETCPLTDAENETACRLAQEAGADFVKTSTGFGGGGATVEDVALMRRVVGPSMGVKASGESDLRPGASHDHRRGDPYRRKRRRGDGLGPGRGSYDGFVTIAADRRAVVARRFGRAGAGGGAGRRHGPWEGQIGRPAEFGRSFG